MDSISIREVGHAIRLGRLKGNTRRSYSDKQKLFQAWLQKEYPDCIGVEGDILLPSVDADIAE